MRSVIGFSRGWRRQNRASWKVVGQFAGNSVVLSLRERTFCSRSEQTTLRLTHYFLAASVAFAGTMPSDARPRDMPTTSVGASSGCRGPISQPTRPTLCDLLGFQRSYIGWGNLPPLDRLAQSTPLAGRRRPGASLTWRSWRPSFLLKKPRPRGRRRIAWGQAWKKGNSPTFPRRLGQH